MPIGLNSEDIKWIISKIKEIMDENRDHLIALDSAMGDGDLGITMTKAFFAANEQVSGHTATNPSDLLIAAGFAIAKAAPSTMGTLMATGFMKGGKAVQGLERIALPDLAVFFHAFVQGIMDRGKASPGEKTVIDVLYPFAQSLSQSAKGQKKWQDAMADAYRIAGQALVDSAQLKAQHGRAAYYQDASIGQQDAGATAGLLVLKGFSEKLPTSSTSHPNQ